MYIFFKYTVCVCIYIYIINIHSTHTYYVNKNLFRMRLIAINHLTALIKLFFTVQLGKNMQVFHKFS